MKNKGLFCLLALLGLADTAFAGSLVSTPVNVKYQDNEQIYPFSQSDMRPSVRYFDVNSDGYLDAINLYEVNPFKSGYAMNLSFVLTDKDGVYHNSTFKDPSSYLFLDGGDQVIESTWSFPEMKDLIVADLDNDGIKDLVVTWAKGMNNWDQSKDGEIVQVYKGFGGLNFKKVYETTFDQSVEDVVELKLTGKNQKGMQNIVVVQRFAGSSVRPTNWYVHTLENLGNLSFQVHKNVLQTSVVRVEDDLIVKDFRRNGILDATIFDHRTGDLRYYQGTSGNLGFSLAKSGNIKSLLPQTTVSSYDVTWLPSRQYKTPTMLLASMPDRKTMDFREFDFDSDPKIKTASQIAVADFEYIRFIPWDYTGNGDYGFAELSTKGNGPGVSLKLKKNWNDQQALVSQTWADRSMINKYPVLDYDSSGAEQFMIETYKTQVDGTTVRLKYIP